MVNIDKNYFSNDEKKCFTGIMERINCKIMLTPGPGAIAPGNAFNALPLFGRGDDEYDKMEERVLTQILHMTGQEQIARLQGSATLALEIATRNFIGGKTLIINTGYYCERLINFCRTVKGIDGRITTLDVVTLDQFLAGDCDELPKGAYDWIVSVYAETSVAIKNDIDKLNRLKKQVNAKLFLDVTASVGLEENHDYADLIAFSSCKGLFAVTGAAFIAWQGKLKRYEEPSFYLNIDTHLNKMMTGRYHPLAALDRILPHHSEVAQKVRLSKRKFIERFGQYTIYPGEREPLIATSLSCQIVEDDDNPAPYPIIFYSPRSIPAGHSVVCHFCDLNLPLERVGDYYAHLKSVGN